MIGGLLDNRTTDTFEKIPFIGDIPILGKFFQSKSVSKTNTELIVIVTPELVRPIPAGQPLPEIKLPGAFMQTNTEQYPRTPGMEVTGPVAITPQSATIAIEKLMLSLHPVLAPIQQQAAPAGGPPTISHGN